MLFQREFLFTDAYPDRNTKYQEALLCLIDAAREKGENDIKLRLCEDAVYGTKMSSIVASSILISFAHR